MIRSQIVRAHRINTTSSCRFSRIFRRLSSGSTPAFDPLRILFLGSDHFSIPSLKALDGLRKSNPELVQSIDVACQPPKRAGRGKHSIREVAVLDAARSLSLPVHFFDIFKKLPKFDLIIAVSFGLIVPSKTLAAVKYGGINVHPSLLPKYRGPAPIQWTLINEDPTIGVTLQALHPTKLDHGRILLQTPELPIPAQIQDPGNSNAVSDLIEMLAPIGADFVVRAIREGLILTRGADYTSDDPGDAPAQASYAHKISTESKRILWNEWRADQIIRRQQVIGPMWNEFRAAPSEPSRRLIWPSQFETVHPDEMVAPEATSAGSMWSLPRDPNVYISTSDGKVLRVPTIKKANMREQPAAVALRRFIRSARDDGISMVGLKLS